MVDPISIAALVLALPGAALAAMDLVDRIAKRRRAAQLLSAASKLTADRKVELWIQTSTGPRLLSELSADELLDTRGDLDAD